MKTALFVDDELRVLDGLRMTARAFRSEWSCEFAVGGAEAIAKLAGHAFDAVVCDARMPAPPGEEVLRYVQEHHPSTVRVVLSGNVRGEAVYAMASVAHRFLTKPCPAQEVFATLNACCAARDAMASPALRALAGKVGTPPPLLTTYRDLQLLLARPEVTTAEIAEVVSRDPAVCAKVLQLVNSAFFGATRPIGTALEAVKRLGFRPLRNVVLAVEAYPGPGGARIQQGAVAKAQVCQELLRGRPDAELGFSVGVLADIGLLLLAVAESTRADLDQVLSARSGGGRAAAEEAQWGVRHEKVSALVLTLWNVPTAIAFAIASQGERHARGPLDLANALEFAIALVEAPSFDPAHPSDELVELAAQLQISTPLSALSRFVTARQDNLAA